MCTLNVGPVPPAARLAGPPAERHTTVRSAAGRPSHRVPRRPAAPVKCFVSLSLAAPLIQ